MPAKSQQLQIRVTPLEKAALKQAARRAGLDVSQYVLARLLPPARARLLDIVGALRRDENRRFALADLNDLLSALTAAAFTQTVENLDLRELTPFLRNYVTAMIEQAANQKDAPIPAWTLEVEPLEDPYFAVPFSTMRLHLLRAAPVAFRRRNLFIDATVGDRV
jgi:uncharacterized protein (DUF1778 family)